MLPTTAVCYLAQNLMCGNARNPQKKVAKRRPAPSESVPHARTEQLLHQRPCEATMVSASRALSAVVYK